MLRGGFVSVQLLRKGTAPVSGAWQSHRWHRGSGATKGGDGTLGRGRTSREYLRWHWGLGQSQNRDIVST